MLQFQSIALKHINFRCFLVCLRIIQATFIKLSAYNNIINAVSSRHATTFKNVKLSRYYKSYIFSKLYSVLIATKLEFVEYSLVLNQKIALKDNRL